MKTIMLTSLFSVVSVLPACGASEGPGDQTASSTMDESMSGDILPGDFKVYRISRQVPTPSCDVHTILEMSNDFAGPVATLRNAVTGPCRIAVNATTRTFSVDEIAGDCGTRRYSGDGLQIIDNRARFCDDLVEADVIIKEATDSVGQPLVTTTFYSFDVLH